VRYPEGLVEAAVVRRLNRFAAEVLVEGAPAAVHLANSGRARELLEPGTPCLLVPRARPHRKTRFDLALVRLGEIWVSADARLPNRLVLEGLLEGRIAPLQRYAGVRAEVRFGASRVDFLLGRPPQQCLVEAKSVTLVEDGVALFPDAPTLRGRRHLLELMEARRQGMAAAVLFVVQRPDAHELRPNDEADPAFGRTLREAAAEGVMLLAYRCDVSPAEIRIADQIPVNV